jgi:hypothetical protein
MTSTSAPDAHRPADQPDVPRSSPAAQRNRDPIAQALGQRLPEQARILEVAGGTGEHALHFTAQQPGWVWQPTDPDAAALSSMRAWAARAAQPNLRPPLALDVRQLPWALPDAPYDAVFCANMIHIAPWPCCGALMHGAAQVLGPQGRLFTYGPYFVQGEPPAEGNLAFDADLRRRNAEWGVRWLHDIEAEAEAAGLRLTERVALPANNAVLVFDRVAQPAPER